MKIKVLIIVLNIPFFIFGQKSIKSIELSGISPKNEEITMFLKINEPDTTENFEVVGFYMYADKVPIVVYGWKEKKHITLRTEELINYEIVGELNNDSFLSKWKHKYRIEQGFNMQFNIVKTNTIVKDTARITGNYYNILNCNTFTGLLSVEFLIDSLYFFSFRTASMTGCSGAYEGIANFNNKYIGVHSKDHCKMLSFRFSQNKITVREKDCGWHGLRCYFIGEYLREQ